MLSSPWLPFAPSNLRLYTPNRAQPSRSWPTRSTCVPGPGTTYAVVGGADSSGEKYSVVGQNGGCAWLQIAKGGKTWGWVSGSKSFVKLSGVCSAIPAAGAAAPAAGSAKQGCALLISQLKFEVKLSVKRGDGWQSAWTIPAGGQVKACVDPGSYTATFTAAGQTGAWPSLVVKGGEIITKFR